MHTLSLGSDKVDSTPVRRRLTPVFGDLGLFEELVVGLELELVDGAEQARALRALDRDVLEEVFALLVELVGEADALGLELLQALAVLAVHLALWLTSYLWSLRIKKRFLLSTSMFSSEYSLSGLAATLGLVFPELVLEQRDLLLLAAQLLFQVDQARLQVQVACG